MKNLWLKISCLLTGWNFDILRMCTEASRKQVKKYSAALIILMFIWGLVGYLFAAYYAGLKDWWSCSLIAIAMITIVLMIERQIILTVGHLGWLRIFRLVIAIVMAIIGSAILDQIIFKDDIVLEKEKIINEEVAKTLPGAQISIQNSIAQFQTEIDTLLAQNEPLYNEPPTIKSKSITKIKKHVPQPDGSTIEVEDIISTDVSAENPKFQKLESNNARLAYLYNQQDTLSKSLITIESKLRENYHSRNPFLMELRAVLNLISGSTVALVFYCLLFLFLVSLELFVVFSKMGDSECDYDVKVRVDRDLRIKQLSQQS